MEVSRELWAKRVTLPVVILTRGDKTEDGVAGFDAGTDDYLRKPFALDERYVRLRTLTPSGYAGQLTLEADNLTCDAASGRTMRGDVLSF